MKKILSSALILFALIGFFGPMLTVAAAGPCDQFLPGSPEWRECDLKQNKSAYGASGEGGTWATLLKYANPMTWLVTALGSVAIAILKLASLLTGLAGAVLNYVVQFSVVDMKANLDKADAVNNAWKVIRDISNMGFIFVLLYAAIMTIIGQGQDNQKLIVRIVVVAILINFSLFFTKVVIDISNIMAITFYDAIAPGALSNVVDRGLSNSLMEPLKITSIWNAGSGIVGERLIIIGVMGTIVSLIAAFVFFAVAIMFIIRFVVLIFVLVLSPIAFVSFVLPKMDKYRDQWWDALSGQAFFAPIYFMLTWIVIVISRGLLTSTGGSMAEALTGAVSSTGQIVTPPLSSMGILVNFIIMIALLIASLTIAKEWAGKAGPAVGKITSWATGAAGDKAFGTLGWAGRTSFGRLGTAAAESAGLQEAANKQRTGRWDRTKGAASRLALYASKKVGGGTYDARNATIPTSAIGAAIEGTVGRTRAGKALGLNDVPIPSIAVGAFAAGQTGVGEGGKKSFIDTRAESAKRVHDREAKAADDLAQARARRDVKRGAQSTATPGQIDAMEKALSKLTDKQTETLVANNRELLKLQNFANAISVKQLEALNKSEQFSETEKDALKTNRFAEIKTIHDPTALLAYTAASAVPVGARSAAQIADIKRVDDARARVRNLSDSELEMIDPVYFDTTRPEALEFISQLSSKQTETITTNKNGKFTSTQKDNVKKQRIKSLMNALTSGVAADVRREIKKADIKTKVSYMKTNGPAGTPIALDNNVLDTYDIKTLQRMALHENMTDGDISTLRGALIARLPVGNPVRDWLEDPNKGVIEFPA